MDVKQELVLLLTWRGPKQFDSLLTPQFSTFVHFTCASLILQGPKPFTLTVFCGSQNIIGTFTILLRLSLSIFFFIHNFGREVTTKRIILLFHLEIQSILFYFSDLMS